MIANRIAYGEEVYRLGAENPLIAVVDADCVGCLHYERFMEEFPERFVECGISEQDQHSIAAGMASCGMTVFAATFAVFSATRALDQVRNMICYNKFNVKVIGTHAGVETGPDGGTHESVEDVAIMRALPNMRVLVPSTPLMTRRLTRLMAETPGPFYMRFGRDPNTELYAEDTAFSLGGSVRVREGKDVAILACGRMVAFALAAAESLAQEGIQARVVDMYSVKPIDGQAIQGAARDIGPIVTVEDHSVIGGLGGAVCEYVAEHCPTRVYRIGVPDTFGRSGAAADLYHAFRIDPEGIAAQVQAFLQ